MTEAQLKTWAEAGPSITVVSSELAAAVLALFAERDHLRGLCEWGSGEPVGPKYDRLQNALARAEAAEAKLAEIQRSWRDLDEGARLLMAERDEARRTERAATDALYDLRGIAARVETLEKALRWGLEHLSDDCSEWKDIASAALARKEGP